MSAMKLVCVLLSAILLALGNAAFAQQFSGRVITMIVNYPAGGPTDIEARIVARHLPKYLQGVKSVIVRNVGGAGGNIGVLRAARASSSTAIASSRLTDGKSSRKTSNEARASR